MTDHAFDNLSPEEESVEIRDETAVVSKDTTPPSATAGRLEKRFEAEYALESPVRCPACGERITTVRAVRLLRAKVNFTSTLPRRGRVITCPQCLAIVPGELTNF